MSVWTALLWGAGATAGLYIGAALSRRLQRAYQLTGLVMGFGAGTLLSAVAYELVPESHLETGLWIGAAVLAGSLVYFFADRTLDRRGAEPRGNIVGDADTGSGMAMFLGALLDGIPESFILGITLSLGGTINVAFVTAVFVSNIPEGVACTTSLKEAGYTERHVYGMWGALTIACAVTSALGYILAQTGHLEGVYAEAFAGGAVLTMLADSMLPEAFKHGGKSVGLLVVFGYLVAAGLSVAQLG